MLMATRLSQGMTVQRVVAAVMVALGVTLLAHGTLVATTSNTAAQTLLAQSWTTGDAPTVTHPVPAGLATVSAAEASELPGASAEQSGTEALATSPVDTLEPAAMLWFERDGMPIVVDKPVLVVAGVTEAHLAAGPGQYPHADPPGGPGNHALAGHRTTYGAPFGNLDVLAPGDTIHIVDRAGGSWVYRVVEQSIVQPDEVWVVGDDPLGTGRPTVTLTTCHPRGSTAQRLVIWGELVT